MMCAPRRVYHMAAISHTPDSALAVPDGIGVRLRRCRELRGVSQMELKARSGIPQQTISELECGARDSLRIQVETLWRLCWVLGTSMDALVGIPELRG